MPRIYRFRSLLSALALLGLFLASVSDVRAEVVLRTIPAPDDAPSPLGDYLVGKYAGATRDMQGAAEYFIRAVRKDPSDIQLLRQTFSLAVVVGRQTDAVWIAEQLRAPDNNPTGLMELVLVVEDFKNRDIKAARKKIDAMTRSGLNSLIAPLLSAWIYVDRRAFDEALGALDKLETSPNYDIFRDVHRALILDAAGRDTEAWDAYRKVVPDPSQADFRLIQAYGRFLARIGKTTDARLLYTLSLSRHPGNPALEADLKALDDGRLAERLVGRSGQGVAEVFYTIGQALARQRSVPAAIIYLRLARILEPGFANAGLLLAGLLESDDQLESALQIYGEHRADAVFGWSTRQRMAALLSRVGRSEDSISVLRKMAKERPDDLSVASSLAEIYRREERYRDARTHYDRAISLVDNAEPGHWPLYYARGVSLERLGKWKLAESDLLSALELKPDEPLVLNYLGYSWVDQGVNLEKALEMIERAVEQRPEDGYIVDSLGWALFRLGQFEEAAAWLEKAAELHPEDPTINDHLGDAYWRIGRKREARFQWLHAVAMGPDSQDVKRIRVKISDGIEAHSVGAGRGPTTR